MLLPSMITGILRLLPSVVTDILRLIGEFRFLPGPSLWVPIEAKGATLRLSENPKARAGQKAELAYQS